MTTYHIYGFNGRERFSVLVDPNDIWRVPFDLAQKIAGPDYHMRCSEYSPVPIPDNAKNKLFLSDKELYAAVPELNPRRRRAAKRPK